MAAYQTWQNSSFRRMPTAAAASSPTAAGRDVAGIMQQQQHQQHDRSHHIVTNSNIIKSSYSRSESSNSVVQAVTEGISPICTSNSSGGRGGESDTTTITTTSPTATRTKGTSKITVGSSSGRRGVPRRILTPDHQHPIHHRTPTISSKESRKALFENDAMVYLDGPQVYTCMNCRTHLTSHDDIISKSFHGRNGRAYLFDQCVNITTSPPEDRILITGLHTVSDISCKRCQELIGWTYAKAYEPSQKYKEGKYIIEKIHLHLEESDYYTVDRPAGERGDKWQVRSMSWGSEESHRGFRCISICITSGSGSWSDVGGSYHHAGTMNRMGSPTLPGVGAKGSYYSRGRSASMGARSSPQTPPTPRQSSTSPGVASLMSSVPKSPRSPSGIIYEYRT